MTIYLSRQYNLSVDLIGYAMTVALTIGVVFSLGFGILADKFDKKRYMLLAICGFASGFIAIPLVHNVVVVVLLFALINCAYSVFATVLKAWFADNLSATNKTKIFSLNYTVLNIGWTVGPPLGTLLVMQSINLPFFARCCMFSTPSGVYPDLGKTFTSSIRRFEHGSLVPLGTAARQSIILVYAVRIFGVIRWWCLCVLYFAIRYGGCRRRFCRESGGSRPAC